jgi:protein phosphatase
MAEIAIPELSLVVLIGVSSSGKSTFARQHFGRYEVLSSDVCRGLVTDDENNQAASKDAFDILEYITGKRLAAGRLTVIDATNVQSLARKPLIELARAHDVLPVAIVFDVPERTCRERHATRTDRDFGDHVIRRQHDQLRRSLRGLAREGFRKVHVLRGVEEVAQAKVVRERLLNDGRDRTGPFDVIGDVHGCREELEDLLTDLGYNLVRDDAGRAVDAVPPAGRTAVFLGDLVDRGPDSPGVLRLVMGMTVAGHALAVPGNHENKLVRALTGRDVQTSRGLATTLTQLAAEPEEFEPRWHGSAMISSRTWYWTAGAWLSPMPGSSRPITAGSPAGCAASRSTATPPARPTSSGCRCATRGRRSTAAAPSSSTGTRPPRSRPG